MVYDRLALFKWHVYADTFPDEKTDREMMAYIGRQNGQWILINYNINGMTSPRGSLVPKGRAILLTEGTVFRMSGEENGLLAEVTYCR